MADALCGPSNALQNFQKHTAVDRSLQQDRLIFRQPSPQSFRPSAGPKLVKAEAEFQAFQAAPTAPPFPLHHDALRHRHPAAANTASTGWASEFQQLHINDWSIAPAMPAIPVQTQQMAPMPSNWQDEFLHGVTATPSGPTSSRIQSNSPYLSAHFHTTSPFVQSLGHSNIPQQSTPLQRTENEHEQELFSREFDLVQQESEAYESNVKRAAMAEERQLPAQVQEPSGEYILSHADRQMGDVTGGFEYGSEKQASGDTDVVDQLRTMRIDGGWEAVDAYERATRLEMERSNSSFGHEIINNIERLRQEESHAQSMASSTRPEESWASPPAQPFTSKIGADTIPSSQYQAERPSPEIESDELSKTAGQLLHNLREEQSAKFQKSTFMELMRQLRDKETKIEGDNMIRQALHPGGKYYPSDAFDDTNVSTAR